MNSNKGDQSSVSMSRQDPPLEGSSKIWSSLWAQINSGRNSIECLFTRGSTRNIYEFWQRAYANDLLNLIQNKNYHDFLELGAGRGTTSMYLIEAGYCKISLIDLSEEARDLANNNFKKYHLNFKDYILADVNNTPLQNESFDCIYNIGLLEHFENPGNVLREAFRLLRKDGLIFMPVFPDMSCPNAFLLRMLFNPLSFIKGLMFSKAPKQESMIRTKLKAADYEKICQRIGYCNVECLYYNPFPKIVRDGWYENTIILNFYKLMYSLNKIFPRRIQFRTNSFFGSAYLLIATK
jgi:ubiquinone/menaquinone biosynthesis C-methylase UbiE